MAASTRHGMDLVELVGAQRQQELGRRNRARRLLVSAIALFAAAFLLFGLGLRQDDLAWTRFGWDYVILAPIFMGLVVGYYFGRHDAPEPVGSETLHSALRLYSEASRMQAAAAEEHALYLSKRLALEAESGADREP